jgi:ATP/maltotriose-dependent transcriptional regulator MalT
MICGGMLTVRRPASVLGEATGQPHCQMPWVAQDAALKSAFRRPSAALDRCFLLALEGAPLRHHGDTPSPRNMRFGTVAEWQYRAMSAGDFDEAQRAMDSCMAQFGERNRETLDAMSRLAKVHISRGDLASARSLQERVFATRREILGPEDPSTIWAANDFANTLQKLGELDLANSIQLENLALVERIYGRDDEEVMVLRQNLASIRYEVGDLAGCAELQEQMVASLGRVHGNIDLRTVQAVANLAYTKQRQGDYLGAIPLQLRSIRDHIRLRLRRSTT